MSSWHSYSSIYNLGHKCLADLFTASVLVEEKVDGSQFSFGIHDGELKVRSKGQELIVDNPEKMFTKAVETAKSLTGRLTPGWTYRCEYLEKPKHNSLAYNRVPEKHLILFDIETGLCEFAKYGEKEMEARRLGLEVVPLLYAGVITDVEVLRRLLQQESILGGPQIEGVVIKPTEYNLFGPDKKVLMGKHVSENFKEIYRKEWKKGNTTGKDILQIIGAEFRTEARWRKAIQHLRESGRIEDSPKDIGSLMKEVNTDVLKECEGEIRDRLFKWAWPHVSRQLTAGLPEWYKQQLLEKQFEEKEAA